MHCEQMRIFMGYSFILGIQSFRSFRSLKIRLVTHQFAHQVSHQLLRCLIGPLEPPMAMHRPIDFACSQHDFRRKSLSLRVSMSFYVWQVPLPCASSRRDIAVFFLCLPMSLVYASLLCASMCLYVLLPLSAGQGTTK